MTVELAEAAGGPTELPSGVDEAYARLRRICDGLLTRAQRDAIRSRLEPALARHIRDLTFALDALDGPDPETAIIYVLDSVPTIRKTLTSLDARLSS